MTLSTVRGCPVDAAMTLPIDPIAIASGFAVGAIVGLTGVGGGSLMTPLLIGVFKLNPAVAIGTDLWFAALTKMGGSVAHHRQGHVDTTIVRRLLTGSLPASVLTVLAIKGMGWAPTSTKMLTFSLGIALLLTAVAVFFRPAWQGAAVRLHQHLPAQHIPALTIACGALLGALVTLSSVGAGALGATLILLLYPNIHATRIVGTDIAHAVPLTLVAGIGHAWLGHVNVPLLLALLVGSLPGIRLGARLTRHLPERLLRSLLAATLLSAGAKVVF